MPAPAGGSVPAPWGVAAAAWPRCEDKASGPLRVSHHVGIGLVFQVVWVQPTEGIEQVQNPPAAAIGC